MLRLLPLALLLLAACAGVRPVADAPARNAAPEPPAPPSVLARIDAEVDRWAGTPYRLGGTGRDGVDCSAFVQAVYADALDLRLPRTTDAQVGVGAPVDRRALRAGDLVFFRPDGGRTNHVGIFLGDGVFAHASTSRGVMRSHLDEPYWRGAYWTSRRVLAAEAAPPATPPARLPAARPAPGRRVGW